MEDYLKKYGEPKKPEDLKKHTVLAFPENLPGALSEPAWLTRQIEFKEFAPNVVRMNSIYAIGECALWDKKLFGLVAPGYNMARVAASQLSGGELEFLGADMSTKLKLLGVEVGSIGDAHAKTPNCKELIYQDPIRDCYKKIILNETGDKLLGAVLVGDTSDYDTLLQYMLNDMDLPEHPECLILPDSAGAPSLAGSALPDTATICSCHNVSKGDIVGAIDGGSCDLASVKSCTKAASGCGGCAALLKSVVDDELASRGVEVNNHLCEHFAYSRQELLHVVKVESIKTFDVLADIPNDSKLFHYNLSDYGQEIADDSDPANHEITNPGR